MHNHKNTFKPLILVLSLLFCSTFVYASNAKNTIQSPLDFTPEEACKSAGYNYQTAVIFAEKLQLAVKTDNRKLIATLASYPLRINKRDKNGDLIHFYIKNRDQFIQQYKNIITPKTKKYILEDNPKNIFCTYEGIGTGSGSIWFSGNRVFVINVF